MQYTIDHEIAFNSAGRVSRRFNGISEITDLIYPTIVDPNTPFDISYNAVNLSSEEQNLLGYMTDMDTNETIEGSQWEAIVQSGAVYFSTVHFDGIIKNLNGSVILGHIEEKKALWPLLIPIGIIALIGIAQW